MTVLEQELQEENERLYQQVGQLQAQLSTMTAKERAVKPLIEEIQQQERSLTELSAYNKSLTDENEKLLKLSESEKKLRDENSSLKQSERELKNELRQKEQENAALMKQTEDLAARIARLNQAMPTQDDIQALSKAMRGAERSADNASILYFANAAVIAVFALLVVFAGWQVYNTRQEVKNASEGIQSVYNAVYNTEGWSVFDGTIMNEWIWSQNHPEAYQRYLQEKKQREQGLK